MKGIIYKFSQLVTNNIPILKPTYSTFKKMNLSAEQCLALAKRPDLQTHPDRARIITNLMTYTRKQHSRQYIKSQQELFRFVLDGITKCDDQVIPAFFANLQYTYQPELYLVQACKLLTQFAAEMNAKSLSNSLYNLAKIARKNIQSERSTDKAIIYNSALLTLQSLKTTMKLKTDGLDNLQVLTEALIAYQKLEIDDIGEHFLLQINNLKFKKFGRLEAQLAHTIHKNGISYPVAQSVLRKLYDCLEDSVNKKQITLTSMVNGASACFEVATKDLIESCQDLYVERHLDGNIQDLARMTNVLMRKGIMSGPYSKVLADSYEALKLNVDINVLQFLIPNMGTMINLRLLEKKYLNMFLISVKVLADQGKINRAFYEQFRTEYFNIESEEIKSKFKTVLHKLEHL